MKDLFVQYELSIRLKENGFNQPCLAKYLIPEVAGNRFRFNTEGEPKNYNDGSYGRLVSAPLYQQVVDWFREKHETVICIYANASGYLFEFHDSAKKGGTHRYDSGYEGPNESGCWDSYYEAMEAAISKALTLIP